jgi:hypothetical protein
MVPPTLLEPNNTNNMYVRRVGSTYNIAHAGNEVQHNRMRCRRKGIAFFRPHQMSCHDPNITRTT